MTQIVVAALYKFVDLPDFAEKREPILDYCVAQGIKGTILLANEGINGTIAGSPQAIADVLAFLRSDPRLADLEHKESFADEPPFERMKVKLKREIVPLGVPGISPNRKVGTYVSPEEWNQIISDPDVVVIDTRNDYEVEIGTFQRALNPQTKAFREFPDYVQQHLDPTHHKKVAMFCTGGIRCEKASSYMLERGFEQVYHLKGGILKYLEEVPEAESLWQGECFVFDQRVAVRHELEIGSYDACIGCGRPISDSDKASEKYQAGISCPHCFDSLTPEKQARQIARWQQLQQAKQQKSQVPSPQPLIREP